jgi:hypothetical protein
MIKASEAMEKKKQFAVKQIETKREKAVNWIETIVAPSITAACEQGKSEVGFSVPAGIEWVYARDYLEENGYTVTSDYGGRKIAKW